MFPGLPCVTVGTLPTVPALTPYCKRGHVSRGRLQKGLTKPPVTQLLIRRLLCVCAAGDQIQGLCMLGKGSTTLHDSPTGAL